jgi:predicted nucleic acid-binding protein
LRRATAIGTRPTDSEKSTLIDAEPVIALFDSRADVAVFAWVYRGGLELLEVDLSAVRGIIDLTQKYDDVPMDLPDATLVVAAELNSISHV